MKRIIIAALCLSLGACASFKNPVSLNTQYDIEAGYLTAENIAVVYMQLPLCRTGTVATLAVPCAQRSIVLKIQSAGRKAQAAVIALRNFVKNNPTLNSATAILAAQNALADFEFAVSATQGH